MDTPSFTIDHDQANRFARIELRGFWTRDTLNAFIEAASRTLEAGFAAGLEPGRGRILVLIGGMPVQDRMLTGDLAGLIPMFGRLAARIAVVANAGALVRLQARRLVAGNGRVFAQEEEALRWLHDATG